MLKYEKPFHDGDRTERLITYNGFEVALLVTERAHEGSMRFKGSLLVQSYTAYIYHINYSSTFYPHDYDNARQALSACKRFIKTMMDHHPIEGKTK